LAICIFAVSGARVAGRFRFPDILPAMPPTLPPPVMSAFERLSVAKLALRRSSLKFEVQKILFSGRK